MVLRFYKIHNQTMDIKNQIIINADDFGKSASINEAISLCFKKNLIGRTTIMVNMPNFTEAISIAKNNSFFDKVGLHINLMEGKPVTKEIMKFPQVCTDGFYNGKLQEYIRSHYFLPSSLKKAIRKEIKAQMRIYIDNGFTLLHIDSHFHLHNDYIIYSIIKPLAKQHKFKSMRILRNLMPKDNIKDLIKYCYKRIINYDIKQNFQHTTFFGSYDDFITYYKESSNIKSSVEIMVHPDINDNTLVDVVDKKFINFSTYNL